MGLNVKLSNTTITTRMNRLGNKIVNRRSCRLRPAVTQYTGGTGQGLFRQQLTRGSETTYCSDLTGSAASGQKMRPLPAIQVLTGDSPTSPDVRLTAVSHEATWPGTVTANRHKPKDPIPILPREASWGLEWFIYCWEFGDL